jgi:hypothetical protein
MKRLMVNQVGRLAISLGTYYAGGVLWPVVRVGVAAAHMVHFKPD